MSAILGKMATPSSNTNPPPDPREPIGCSNWRSEVLRQAEHLSKELAAISEADLADASSALVDQISDHLAAARAIANDVPRSWKSLGERWRLLCNWWTGNAVETAWDHLQTAREDLFMVEPTATVRAQLPSLQRRLAKASPDPAHDPQAETIRQIAQSANGLSAEDRGEIRAAHEHVRFTEDDHSEARGFRNNLLLLIAGLTIIAPALAAITTDGFDYLLIGAGAGMLTTALAWRSLTHLTGPFAVNTTQAMLKIPAGAVSALLGVILVHSGTISGLHVSSSTAYGYAVVFGLSQQALTQVVDSAAKKIGA